MSENLVFDFLKSRITCEPYRIVKSSSDFDGDLMSVVRVDDSPVCIFHNLNPSVECEVVQVSENKDCFYFVSRYIDLAYAGIGFDMNKYQNLIEPLAKLNLFEEMFCFSITFDCVNNESITDLIHKCINAILANIGLSRIAMGGYEITTSDASSSDVTVKILITMSHLVLTRERLDHICTIYKESVKQVIDSMHSKCAEYFANAASESFDILMSEIERSETENGFSENGCGILEKYGDDFKELVNDENFKSDIIYIINSVVSRLYL